MTEVVEVVVEIPKGSRNKYEYDHERDVIRLDRRLFTATAYPADYGFIPDTLAEDGDPLDALVLVDDPTFPGCRIEARAVGVLYMKDEAGRDAKIISVPCSDPIWAEIKELGDIPDPLLSEIHHFFDVYKMLEPRKETSTIGYEGLESALQEVEDCRRRYEEQS